MMNNEDDILKNLIKYSDETDDTFEEEITEHLVHEASSLDNSDEAGNEECFSADNDEEEEEVETPVISEPEQPVEPTQTLPKKRYYHIYAFCALTIVAVIVLFSVVDGGIIGTYKKNFSANLITIFDSIGIDIRKKPPVSPQPISDTSAITEDMADDGKTEQIKVKATPTSTEAPEYNTDVEFAKMLPFDGAADSSFAAYKKGVICAKTNTLCYIGATGEKEWELTTSVIDPILQVEEDYILIAQRNGRKLCLYSNNKLLYDIDSQNNILACGLNGIGDAVVVTDKPHYKGALSVYNKNGEEIYAWSSGSDLILDADISTSSRRIAATLLNTDTEVKSAIALFNVNKENSYERVTFEDTALFDVVFIDEEINAFGDNSTVGINTSGKVLFDKRFDDVELVNYTIDNKGSKIMVFNSENIPMMNIYNSAGVLKYTVTTQQQSDFVDINSYNIIYNNNRDVFLGKPNSRKLSKYTASMDIKKLVLIDSRTFAIVYSNSVEFVKI